MNWTQPMCGLCWEALNPDGRAPVRITKEHRRTERCCLCGLDTLSGIYVRRDPRTVPFPAENDE